MLIRDFFLASVIVGLFSLGWIAQTQYSYSTCLLQTGSFLNSGTIEYTGGSQVIHSSATLMPKDSRRESFDLSDIDIDPVDEMEQIIIDQHNSSTDKYVRYSDNIISSLTQQHKNIILFFYHPESKQAVRLDKEISAKLGLIPDNTTIIKINIDEQDALRKQYCIDQPGTFVTYNNDSCTVSTPEKLIEIVQ